MIDYVKRLAGPYTGAGQTTFSFGFKVYEETDIYVATALSNDEAATNLNYGDDYSVTLNDDQDAAPGGSITLKTALVDGEILVIGSDLDYTQELQLTNYTRFPPEQINEALDRLCIQIQQILEITGRALLVPATSSTTPTEMIERLLSAQHEAQASADVATNAAAESQKILDQVKEYGSAATVLEPYADDISTVAGNIDSVKATGGNITNVNIVAGDLDTTTQPVDLDYGDYDDNTGSGTAEVAVGGSIKTVADNIAQVQNVSANMASILAIEDKIDGLDQTVEEMEAAAEAAETAQAGAETAATQAVQSAQDAQTAKTQADSASQLSKDWAIKLDGKVTEAGVEIDFSSKYWAIVASQAATEAQNQVTLVEQAGDSAVADINSAQSTAVSAVASQQTTSVSAVQSAQSSAESAIQTAKTNAISAVEAGGGEQVALAKAQADAAASSATAASSSASAAAESASEANTAKMSAETAASTATSKATEASNSASAANTAKTAAETAQAAAESARDEAQQIAGELGDPLGKNEAAQTYATKAEMNTGLSGKSDTGHSHTIADVASLQASLDGKLGKTEKATSASTADAVAWSNVDGKPETFTPSEHTHTLASISNAGSLAAKNEITEAELAATIDLGEYSDV